MHSSCIHNLLHSSSQSRYTRILSHSYAFICMMYAFTRIHHELHSEFVAYRICCIQNVRRSECNKFCMQQILNACECNTFCMQQILNATCHEYSRMHYVCEWMNAYTRECISSCRLALRGDWSTVLSDFCSASLFSNIPSAFLQHSECNIPECTRMRQVVWMQHFVNAFCRRLVCNTNGMHVECNGRKYKLNAQ